ncbi:MAG: AAA family ATPase [Planctomycetota bacterium]
MKIVKFSAENIKRLCAVEVTPAGELVVIGGKNDAGKSSLLDAIEMAMCGEAQTPGEPVRRGQDSGRVVLDLGDIIVTRLYGSKGSRKLVVSNKDGARYPSPQAMLDKLYSSLSFDPLEFERQERKAQAETLRRMVGLDTTLLDAERARVYAERAEANKSVKALQVQAESLARYEDAPLEEVSIAGIADELRQADKAVKAFRDAERVLERAQSTLAGIQTEQATIRKRLADLDVAEVETLGVLDRQHGIVAAARDRCPDQDAIRARLSVAEGTNQQVRANAQHAGARSMLADAQHETDRLTATIEALDADRVARLAAVSFPVEGLGLDAETGDVTLDGLPFDQASTSDRIRVSVAIGLATNPTLRVLLVRDGSLLGSEKLALLAEMAAAADCQVWLEMLAEDPADPRVQIYIEDGRIKG